MISKTQKKLRVAVYIRVSTNKQETSLENQRNFFINYVNDKEDWTLHDIYIDEALTGTKSEKRKSLKKLLVDGKNKEFDILIAKSYSRFGRNQRETLTAIADLVESDVRIIFLEDNLDSDKDMHTFGLFAWLSEQESRKISDRIQATWKHYNNIGQIYCTFEPFGYDYDSTQKNYIINKEESKTVRKIFDLYLQGYGTRKIGSILNKEKIPTKRGGEWYNSTITSILQNPVFIGTLVQGKTKTIDITVTKRKSVSPQEWHVHEDSHEPIIEKDIFYKVQEEIKKRSIQVEKKLPNGFKRHSNTALFSTLIKCKECGGTFVVRRKKQFRDYTPHYSCVNYHKYGKEYCGHKSIHIYEDTLVKVLKEEIKRLIVDGHKTFKTALGQILSNESKVDYKSDLRNINKAINGKIELSNTLLQSFSKGLIGENQFRLQNEQIEKEISVLLTDKKRVELQINEIGEKVDIEKAILKTIEKFIEMDSSMWTNTMLKEVIDVIYIDENKNIEVHLKYNEIVPTSIIHHLPYITCRY